ncbi:TPA: helix-turn-helix domain-containing protein [Mannheimia haemolytica]|uniref:helix-turn-helix domain-containing protein n=1 Tax=Mannheimia haemolytica TaxID=75985 RepID=UPI0001594C03|nr:helix-turn-helix domain-containing protein [Mannheimia haemolytica]AWW71176.1 helix-turn-helix domain-containing protein [Pasteurellaceae bacterium 12565]AGI32294.2 helix-turn-helix domain-containing protein [Mannheimia haemolytica USDA-ARS-USMARC-183]AGK02137.1 putative HTH domain-containing bacteriophage replication protein [Mannheimia haemolytica M42548]AGQ24988.1 hypothetical protein F382_02985 [Mannheimia haemolytica D153]AGQ40556.1 hypothetical protein J451_03290 [Mannheimia haemolyti
MSMLLMVKAMNCTVGNSARKLVLLKLADNANDDGVCFPSYQFIADKCEMSKRSAISHIDELIKMGYVSKKSRKNKDGSSSNLYQLHLDAPSEKSALGGENFAPGGSENSAPITSHSINQSINHNTSEQNSDGVDKKSKYRFSDNDMAVAKWIFKRVKQLAPQTKESYLPNWANEVRLMVERDKHTHQEICSLFKFATEHHFWGRNILSVVSLRAKWDRLNLERQSSLRPNNIHSATGNGDIQDTTGFSKGLVVDVGGGTKWEF